MPEKPDITVLLNDLTGGNRTIVDALLPEVYDELRRIAARQLMGERHDHTLNTTALVHEAYLKLVRQDKSDWKNRAHFFGIAALAMRRILINYANQRLAEKRGGGVASVTFDDSLAPREARAEELIALDEALSRLEKLSERQAKVVTMRYFGGLKQAEIAEALGVSEPTVRRDWQFAKAWLTRELADDQPPES